MKIDWLKFIGKTLNVTMHENYGLTIDTRADTTIYEIVFKSGKLSEVFDDGLLLETKRENELVRIYIPLTSIKCVEIFNF
ncbi:MAG: hypothetical protein K8H86_14330 [Ignavibacteriaceae bacterium]|nr:hypothetical protein [Ignavibacteriaceae bacterium]